VHPKGAPVLSAGRMRKNRRVPCRLGNERMAREYVTLECMSCGSRNYRTQMETRGDTKLRLKKYCPRERKHTEHRERKK